MISGGRWTPSISSNIASHAQFGRSHAGSVREIATLLANDHRIEGARTIGWCSLTSQPKILQRRIHANVTINCTCGRSEWPFVASQHFALSHHHHRLTLIGTTSCYRLNTRIRPHKDHLLLRQWIHLNGCRTTSTANGNPIDTMNLLQQKCQKKELYFTPLFIGHCT